MKNLCVSVASALSVYAGIAGHGVEQAILLSAALIIAVMPEERRGNRHEAPYGSADSMPDNTPTGEAGR